MKANLLIVLIVLTWSYSNAQTPGEIISHKTSKEVRDNYGRIIRDKSGRRINYSQQETENLLETLKTNKSSSQILNGNGIPDFTNNTDNCDASWKYPIIGNLQNRTIATADFDNDGKSEIVTCMNSSGYSYWYIVKYDSISKKYEQVWISELCATSISSIKTFDINADGHQEIIIGYNIGYSTGKIEVYDGQTKQLLMHASIPGSVLDIEFGDGDNDGSNELIVSDNTNLYFYNPANLSQKSSVPYGSFDFKVGNVDNDGYNQIVLSSGKVIEYKSGSVNVQWTYDSTSPTSGYVCLSDIDGDGIKEMIIAKSWQAIDVYDADIESLKYELTTAQDIASLIVCDVNNDGIDEIIYGDGQWGSVYCYNSITKQKIWQITNPEWGGFSLCAADFNNDDSLRVIWSSNIGCSNASRLLVANTVSSKVEWESLPIDGPFTAVEVDDIDGDGNQEIVALSVSSDNNYDSGILSVFDAQTKQLKWQGDGLFFGQAWTGTYNLKIDDIDNDGHKEIIVAASSCYTGEIWIIDGVSKTIKKNYTYNTENLASFYSLDVADVDQDGNTEIVAGENDKIDIINPADMSVKWSSAVLQASNYIPIIATDIDGDSINEIIACSSYLYKFKGATHQQFQSTSSGYTAIAIADIDNDGNKEIIAGKTNGTIDIVNPVNFQIKSTINIGNTYSIDAVQVKDLNNDGHLEIIFTANGSIFFYADSSKHMISKKYCDKVGAYDGLKIQDINGDGKNEIILGSSAMLLEVPSDCYKCLWFSASINLHNVSCSSNHDGSITVIPDGTSPYTYQWSNGASASTAANLTVGTYMVTTTDNLGCVIIDTVSISQSHLIAQYNSTNEGCSPTNNGTASVTINQGTAPYTYHWNTGPTSSSITNLNQGNYSVTITDAQNCTTTHTFIIQKDTLYLNYNKSNVSCYGMNNGNIYLYPQGTSPYVYSWNTGQNTAYLYYLGAGTYLVTVTDSKGCIANDSTNITQPTQIISQTSTTPDNVNTPFGEGTATVNVVGGTPPYTLAWNDPFMQTTVTAINLVAGMYIVTITDNDGCKITDTATVNSANGINEIEFLSKIKLYPNPTNSILYSDFEYNEGQNLSINIYNIFGKLVFTTQLSDVKKIILPINMSSFESGVYTMNVCNDKINSNYKILLIK
jgi:hypothetical protein